MTTYGKAVAAAAAVAVDDRQVGHALRAALGIEHEVVPGVVESIKIMTRTACERICRFAFEYARKRGRKKVTAVHKANIMKYSDGLFLAVAREVAKEYTDIEFEDRIVDNMCMQLVQRPHEYDVLVLPNLFGDIVSYLASGLVGGLGVAPGANFGQDLAGEIVYAEQPRKGREITAPDPFMSLESGKWVGRVKAIVSGKIVDTNEEIEWESTIINEDPYGEGWFAKVELSGQPEGLMKTTDP